MLRFNDFIIEKESINFHLSFPYKGKEVEFNSQSRKDIYTSAIDWVYNNGYTFKGRSLSDKLLTPKDVDNLLLSNRTYRKDHFHNVKNSDKFIIMNAGFDQLMSNLVKILTEMGVKKENINVVRGAPEKNSKDDIKLSTDEIKPKTIENPFKQAIAVLGDPSAGKSTTVRKVLRAEGHKIKIWEPDSSSTNLTKQWDSKLGYVSSPLGSLLIEAYKNPNKCHTLVIEEFHKSNIIDKINDELKHAISLKRYEGDRFISADRTTEYLNEFVEFDEEGNIKIPDNFGFIFISSKPDIIANNRDVWSRLDIIVITTENREDVENAEDLLNLVISDEEKNRMVSEMND